MVQPMNYTINTGNPGASFMQGAEQVANFANMQATVQAKQQEAAAMQAAADRKAYQQKRFQEAAMNPNGREVQKLMIEFPELSEQFKRSYDTLNDKEKETATRVHFMVRSAVGEGKPEIAVQELDRMIEAAKNSGDALNLNRLEMERDLLVANPQAARFVANGFLASTMGPDKYTEMIGKEGEEERKQEMQPSALKKSEADAEKAAVAAKFAESQAVMDLEKSGWDIKKIQNDMQVSRQNVAIAAANAAVNRANSATAQQEAQIKLQQLVEKRDETVREKTAVAESARASIDNFLNTTDRLLQNPMLDRVVGAVQGRVNTAPLSGKAADAIAMIETLNSQIFLNEFEKLKGAGAITDMEGTKAQQALTNLTRVQSKEQFLENINEARRIMLDNRARLAKKYGIPDTIPNTPAAAAGTPGTKPVDEILKELGVQ